MLFFPKKKEKILKKEVNRTIRIKQETKQEQENKMIRKTEEQETK